jgi:hypothetical protein
VKAPQLPPSVVVTRARHPLEGRELRVLGWMRRHGCLELLLELPDGSKRLILAEHTSQRDCQPGGTGNEAGTLGQTADLLAACALIAAFRTSWRGEAEQAARKPPAREDDRAACPAQSAAGTASGATRALDRPAPRGRRRRGGHAAGCPDRQDGGPGGDRQ